MGTSTPIHKANRGFRFLYQTTHCYVVKFEFNFKHKGGTIRVEVRGGGDPPYIPNGLTVW